jgi:peptidoglycan/LPS O-acetylase OafA/YrhL
VTLAVLVVYLLVIYLKWHITVFDVPFALTDRHGQLFSLLLLPAISLIIISLTNAKKTGFFGRCVHYFFENRWIVYIGKISYGLYLFHYPVFYLMDEYLKRYGITVDVEGSPVTYLVAAAKFLITFLIAVLSWHFFESKVLKYKSKFSYKFIAA